MAQEPANPATNQSGDTGKNSTELEELQLKQQQADTEKAISDAEKAATEARMAAIKAKWPISETEGLKGTIKLEDSAGYYAEILAYLALCDAAKEIAAETKNMFNSEKLIILGEVDLSKEKSLWNLLNLKLDLAIKKIAAAIPEYKKQAEAVGRESAVAIEPFIAAPAILGAITDIVAFFKRNYTLTGREIVLNEKALKAAVASQIRSSNSQLLILLPEFNLSSKNGLFDNIKRLDSLVRELESTKDKIVDQLDKKIEKNKELLKEKEDEKKKIEEKMAKLSNGSEELKKLKSNLDNVEIAIANLKEPERKKEEIVTSLDEDITAGHQLIATLTTNTDSTDSPLESIATIDFIHRHSKAKILYLTIASQGGEVETSESSIAKGRISYMGGVVVTYFLSDIDGVYYQSGNIHKIRKHSFKRKDGHGEMNMQ